MNNGPVGIAPTRTSIRAIPWAAWWILLLMTMDNVLGMIDRNAVSVLKTTLKQVLSINDSEYSILVTAFMVPFATFYIICGRLVDRYGSRVTLTIFVSIWSLATVATGLSDSLWEMAFWRAVLGAAEAGLLPASIYALVVWFPRDLLATVYAIKNPLQALGPILTPPVVAGLTLAFGWRYAFIVPGVLGLVFAVLWWFSDRNPPSYAAQNVPPPSPRLSLLQLLGTRLLLGIMLARLVSDSLWFFLQYWQAGYLQEVMGLDLAAIGRLLWIPPAVNCLFMIFTATLSDRLIARGWSAPRSRLWVMQLTIVLAPCVAIVPFVSSVPVVLALLTAGYCLAFTWLYLSNIFIANLFPKEQVGSAIGLVNCVGTVGAAAVNAAVGPLIETVGYLPLFIGCALLHPIALIILRWFYRDFFRPQPA